MMQASKTPRRHRRLTVLFWWISGGLVLFLIGGVVAWNVSVWPSLWSVRVLAGSALDGSSQDAAAAKYVPSGIVQYRNVSYSGSREPGALGRSADERMDVYRPAGVQGRLPTVVWVHGGGFIAGSKDQMANWLRIVASSGFVVVGVNYTVAPTANYPTPVVQVSRAISRLVARSAKFHIDPNRLVVGGDSAGAHIATQATLALTDTEYAARSGLRSAGLVPLSSAQIVGSASFSGVFDPFSIRYDRGVAGFFARTILWAYSGEKRVQSGGGFDEADLPREVTQTFPPTFVSTGPGDPLLGQNREWARALRAVQVPVTTKFFDARTTPDSVGHEYQMHLNTVQGRGGVTAFVAFVRRITGAPRVEGAADTW